MSFRSIPARNLLLAGDFDAAFGSGQRGLCFAVKVNLLTFDESLVDVFWQNLQSPDWLVPSCGQSQY